MGCSGPVCSQMAPLSCEGTDCSQPALHELAARTLLLMGTSPAVSLPQRLHELQHSPASIFHPCRKEAKGVSQGLPDRPLGTALGPGAGQRPLPSATTVSWLHVTHTAPRSSLTVLCPAQRQKALLHHTQTRRWHRNQTVHKAEAKPNGPDTPEHPAATALR